MHYSTKKKKSNKKRNVISLKRISNFQQTLTGVTIFLLGSWSSVCFDPKVIMKPSCVHDFYASITHINECQLIGKSSKRGLPPPTPEDNRVISFTHILGILKFYFRNAFLLSHI